jgi:hypothetical protein
LVEADHEFYLASDVVDLTRRQPHWKHVGFVENLNRTIDEEEFVRLLAAGPEIRKQVYAATEPSPKPIAVPPSAVQHAAETANAAGASVPHGGSQAPAELVSAQGKPGLFSRLMGRS